MIQIFALFLSLFAAQPAVAQCNGSFGANTLCGTVSKGPPGQVSMGSVTTVTNAATAGWVCDSTDHSTIAQTLINSVSSVGGTIWFPPCTGNTYRADSQLTLPISTTTLGSEQTQASIRFTGAGAGATLFASSPIYTGNSATLDLRYKGQVSSAVGYVNTVGSGYTSGTETITVTGGTCSQQPVYQVVVAGGSLVQAQFPGGGPNGDLNSHISLVTAGVCTIPPANPVSFTGAGAGTGGTLNLYWTGGKLQSLGGGGLEVDHLTIVDNGSANATPFIYWTNASAFIHDNNFIGTGHTSQDALVCGGMQASGQVLPPNQTADSPCLGYGTIIDHNDFFRLARAFFARTFSNEMKVTNNINDGSCVGDRFMETISGQSGGINYGLYFGNNYTEACVGLKYGYVIGNTRASVWDNNSVWDTGTDPSFISDYFFPDNTSAPNTFILGHGSFQEGHGSVFSGNATPQALSTVIGPVNNFFNGSNVTNSFDIITGTGLLAQAPYNGANCPPGGVGIVDANNEARMLAMGVNNGSNQIEIDAVNAACTSGQNMVLNPKGGPLFLGGTTTMSGSATFTGTLINATTVSASTVNGHTMTASQMTVQTSLFLPSSTIASLPVCNSSNQGMFMYVTNAPSPMTYNTSVNTLITSVFSAPVFCGVAPTSANAFAWTYH